MTDKALKTIPLKTLTGLVKEGRASVDDFYAQCAAREVGVESGAQMSVISAAGITWRCVRTWQGGRRLERQLKNRKEAPALCPVCSGEKANKRANFRKAVK